MRIILPNMTAWPKNTAPSFTPSELGASFARFSRNAEGLEAIHESTRDLPDDKRCDAIFKMADYGHRSILKLVQIPIAIESISMISAARIMQKAKLCGAQEASTRFIAAKESDAEARRQVFKPVHRNWMPDYSEAQYDAALKMYGAWESATKSIPATASRIERNKVLDQVRYTLPAISQTNIALTMSAQAWTELLSKIVSIPMTEFYANELQWIARAIKEQICLVTGTELLVKHAEYNYADMQEWRSEAMICEGLKTYADRSGDQSIEIDRPTLFRLYPRNFGGTSKVRTSRYSTWPPYLHGLRATIIVRQKFAEMRDLNRHTNNSINVWDFCDKSPDIVHSLGSECVWMTDVTLAQALYMFEIRTGDGAHPSYAKTMYSLYTQLLSSLYVTDEELARFIENNSFVNNWSKS